MKRGDRSAADQFPVRRKRYRAGMAKMATMVPSVLMVALTKRFDLDAVTLSKVVKNGELGAVEGKKIKRILESPKPALIVSGTKKIDSAYLAILKRNSLVLMSPSELQLNESLSKAGSAAASESQAEK